MTIGSACLMTKSTHQALGEYRDHIEATTGKNYLLPEVAGNLIAEALQGNGYIERAELLPGRPQKERVI
jgi:hypothetical protein